MNLFRNTFIVIPTLLLFAIQPTCKNKAGITEDVRQSSKENTMVNSFGPIAVLELFTSQGCNSCPPADNLLKRIITTAEYKKQNIYALSFHVDYWNRLGWQDPFSKKEYSKRQADYVSYQKLNSAYTPQLIVNGKWELVGSDAATLSKVLAEALSEKTPVNFARFYAEQKDGVISAHYKLEGNYKDTVIHLALVSSKEVTIVKSGENGGRTLENENVVIDFITKTSQQIGDISLTTIPADLNGHKLIAYIQNKEDKKIVAAVKASINAN